MKAPDIKHKVERALDTKIGQLADISFDKGCSWSICSALSRSLNGRRGKINPYGFPSMLSQIDDIGSSATAQIECATGGKRCGSLNYRHHLRRSDAGIPTRSAKPVHHVVLDTTPRHVVLLLSPSFLR